MSSEWLARQGFLGPNNEVTLSALRIAVIGLGGGGSHVVQQLAHIGIGTLVLMDPQRAEHTNLNRLVGCTLSDVTNARLKTVIARRIVRRINSAARVITVAEDWRTKAELLRDCDLIIGCVDTYATRAELEVVARRFLVPYLDIGMDVHAIDTNFHIAGQVVLSMPGRPCMRCMGFLTEKLLVQEAATYGRAGSRPQVVWPNGVLASLAVGVAIQQFTPWHDRLGKVMYLEYDGDTHTVSQSNLVAYAPTLCSHFAGVDSIGDPWFKFRS